MTQVVGDIQSLLLPNWALAARESDHLKLPWAIQGAQKKGAQQKRNKKETLGRTKRFKHRWKDGHGMADLIPRSSTEPSQPASVSRLRGDWFERSGCREPKGIQVPFCIIGSRTLQKPVVVVHADYRWKHLTMALSTMYCQSFLGNTTFDVLKCKLA